jgi:TonB family protein
MIKVSLIVLAGLLTAGTFRRRSAAVRHWILAASIACAAVLPALELVVPSWQLPGASLFTRAVEPLKLTIPIALPQAIDNRERAAAPAGPDGRAMAWRAAGVIWLAGTAISLGILLVGLARLAYLAARSRAVTDGPWTVLMSRLSREYGIRRPVALLHSEHPTLLATWGLRRAKVVLPQEARHWPEARVRIVLGHELAHVQRRDWLVQMVAELLRCVYWFNPLVWLACWRLRQESEHACDDLVLSLGVEGKDYAGHLLDVARAFTNHPAAVFPAPGMARPSSLERRVRAMLNSRLNRTPLTRASCIAVFLVLVGLTAAIAGVVASAQSTSATFTGTLVDAVGRILPNSKLVLVDANTNTAREATSDASGRFALTAVPPGDYLLEVRIPGFEKSQGRVTLGAGQVLERDIALQIGGIMETVTVSSRDAETPPRRGQPPAEGKIADRCAQAAVGGCIMPPIRIGDARPRYPQAHRDSGTEGKVDIDGRIGTDGFIKDIRVVAPADPEFANATVAALRQWQFTATRLDGVPVEANIHVIVRFVQ